MRKYLTRLCKAIIADKFNDLNYRTRKTWHGRIIETSPLFCSYGQIGFTADVYDERNDHYCHVSVDWELGELDIDYIPWKEYINLLYLEENDISHAASDHRELETYTDAGEDMIIQLDKVNKKHLQSYIDCFDINEKVAVWWPNGRKVEGMGVPFDNMKEHYEDYAAYIKELQRICDKMPY